MTLWPIALAVVCGVVVTYFGALERSALTLEQSDITIAHRQMPWISIGLVCVVTAGLAYIHRGYWWQTVGLGGVVGASFAIALVDWHTNLIPDRLQIIGAGFALLMNIPDYNQILFGVVNGLAVAGVLFALTSIYERFRGKTGLGMGDIKLYAWTGLVCQQYTVLVVALSTILAIPFAIANIKQPHKPFPFGPCIILSMLLFQPIAA
jgi:prepilin signal peptidase PulO-like enzyme (type II secretory pathway)